MSGDSDHPDPDRTQTGTSQVDMLPAGTVLSGRYRLEEVIGVGGMGMVYRARDSELDTDVAIKLLRTDRQPDETTLARFRREVLLARKVSHPNVVRLHDIGSDGRLLFVTMDLVPGMTLRDRISEGALTIDEVIAIGQELASALAAAHAQGVIHRDLKPGNVLIDGDGHARILDFGVARAMDQEQLTIAGEIVGTPAYLAPEQVRGDPVDHRSDIFSLGLILVEALAGRLPGSDGTLREMLGQRATGHTADPARLCPDIPAWLMRILRNCLAARPDDRYQQAAELADDLKAGRARSTTRRHYRRSALAIGVVALVGLLLWHWQSPRPSPESGPSQPPPATLTSLAVLPITNASGRETLDWASRSLARGLAQSLAESASLQVTDSLRLFRLLNDLGLDEMANDGSEQRQLFELLDIEHLVSGQLLSTDDGLRIELAVHEADNRRPTTLAAGAPAGAPLDSLPQLTGEVMQALTGSSESLPQPPGSGNNAALAEFDRGLELLSRGETVAAIEPLERAVAADPSFAAAWSHLGTALAAAGHRDRAIDSAETAVELLDNHGGRLALEARAGLARLGGRSDQARELLETLLERFPGDTTARLQLAEVLIDQGRLEQARGELQRITESEPQHGQAWFLLGKTAIMGGNPARAAEDYLVRALVVENRTGSNQGRGDVINALGIAHLQLGELETSADYFDEAAELRTRAGDRRGVAATRINLAHLHMLLGNFERSREELAMALSEREAIGDRAGMADIHNQRGILEEEVGDYRAALASYRDGLRLNEMLGRGSALSESYTNVAFAYYMLGEYGNARQYNRSALERLDTETSPVRTIMALETAGYLALRRGDWDEALKTFVEVLELARNIDQPQSEAVARGGIGLVARHQGRFDAALEALDEALSIVTRLDDARGQAIYHLHLAELMLAGGRLDAAREQLEANAQLLGNTATPVVETHYRRLRGQLALIGNDTGVARERLAQAESVAAEAGLSAHALHARVLQAGIDGDDSALAEAIEAAERLGDGLILLDALTRAAGAAFDRGESEQAAALARRALRAPVRITPRAGNWRLHWLLARTRPADSRSPDLSEARAEIRRLLQSMPPDWQAAFRRQLPAELADVEAKAG